MSQRRRNIIWGLVFLGPPTLYLGIIPRYFWPIPKVQVEIPKDQPLREDLSLDLTVSGWHSNFRIHNVRFYVDASKTSAHAEGKPLLATTLYNDGKAPTSMSYGGVSRVTWPHDEKMRLTVPLKTWAEEERTIPGLLVGKLDVEISYPQMHGRLNFWLGYSMVRRRISVPFSIRLEP